MKNKTFILGRFNDKEKIEYNKKKLDDLDEKIESYVDSKTNELVIKFVPVKKNNVKK